MISLHHCLCLAFSSCCHKLASLILLAPLSVKGRGVFCKGKALVITFPRLATVAEGLACSVGAIAPNPCYAYVAVNLG